MELDALDDRIDTLNAITRLRMKRIAETTSLKTWPTSSASCPSPSQRAAGVGLRPEIAEMQADEERRLAQEKRQGRDR